MEQARTDRHEGLPHAIAPAGLLAGLAGHLGAGNDLAQTARFAGVVPVLAAPGAEMLRNLARREQGSVLVAVQSLAETPATAAGAALLSGGGNPST